MKESAPEIKRTIPQELNELYGFFTLTELNESSLHDEYEENAKKYLENILNSEEKKTILEKIKRIPREEFLKEDEFEGFYNFCIVLKNLLESELKNKK